MNKGLFLVVFGLGLMAAVSGCCRCKKDVMATDMTPTAYAQTSASQSPQDQAGFAGARAIK